MYEYGSTLLRVLFFYLRVLKVHERRAILMHDSMPTLDPNLLDPRALPPEVRARKRRRRTALVAAFGAIAIWQAIAGGARHASTLDPLAPLALVVRVGRIITGAEPLFADRDRVNVLLLGIGGAGHDGPLLTDTMILASFKPSTNRLAFISVPRDLEVDAPGVGRVKMNAVHALAEARDGSGGEAAMTVMSKTFDIHVPYYIRVDFSGFEKLIDDLGGVTVRVERAFTDEQFPAGENLFETISFAAGEQQMNGRTALRFARSRHGSNNEGSDFARSRRQQLVLRALADKLFSLDTMTSPAKIKSIYTVLARHLKTNIGPTDAIRLAGLIQNADRKNIIQPVLDTGPNGLLVSAVTEEGAFVLRPGDGSGATLRDVVKNVFDETRVSAAAAHPLRVEVRNGTAVAGRAYAASLTLREHGFTVPTYGNAERRDYKKSVLYDYTGGLRSKEVQQISDLFHADRAATIPTWLPAPDGNAVDVLLIIGDDGSTL